MDNELFKQRLSEVAEWKIPETAKEANATEKKKPGRKSAEDEYMELREEIFYEEFGGVNPTYTPVLVKVKCAAVDCNDCGKHCESGRQKEIKLYKTGRKQNWREKCVTCGLSQNPFNGRFELTSQQAPHVWTNFLRDRKGVYNTPGNQAHEESHVVIRKYPDTEQPL